MSEPALPAKEVTKTPLPIWSCEFFALKEGTAMESLTVGDHFGWKCHGDIAVSWEQNQAPRLAFAKQEETFSLHVLKVLRQDPNDVQYEVTAYKPGEHQPEYVRVVQGEKGFEAAKPKWKVTSVLDPQKQPQPYGPTGPWQLSIPMWFLVAIALGLVLIGLLVYRRVRKYNQRRRMLEDLKLHKTALPPLHQFYRDARQIRRRLNTMKDESELKSISEALDREFRLFVLRQFQIPALDWSNRAIVEDLRKRHRKTYRAAGVPLRKTLRELTKLKTRQQMNVKDVEQLHRMSMDAAEKLEARV